LKVFITTLLYSALRHVSTTQDSFLIIAPRTGLNHLTFVTFRAGGVSRNPKILIFVLAIAFSARYTQTRKYRL
jgi:hypothetical protein